jgi:predicted transcriptional regulator
MMVKTSITLSPATLKAIDRLAGKKGNRSEVIERAVLDFVERKRRAERDAREIEAIDRDADALNREMSDTLEFQVDVLEAGCSTACAIPRATPKRVESSSS